MYLFTALSDVTDVRVIRSPTQLTIKWNKLNKKDIYNYILHNSTGYDSFLGTDMKEEYSHNYSQLTPGKEYSFTLFTEVNGEISNGYSFKNITSKF